MTNIHSRPSDSQDFGAAKRAKLDVVRVDGVSSKVTASADDDGRDDAVPPLEDASDGSASPSIDMSTIMRVPLAIQRARVEGSTSLTTRQLTSISNFANALPDLLGGCGKDNSRGVDGVNSQTKDGEGRADEVNKCGGGGEDEGVGSLPPLSNRAFQFQPCDVGQGHMRPRHLLRMFLDDIACNEMSTEGYRGLQGDEDAS